MSLLTAVDDGDHVTAEPVAPYRRCRQKFVDEQEMTKHMNQIHSCFRYEDAQPIVQKMTKKLVKEAIQAGKIGKQMDLKKNPKNKGMTGRLIDSVNTLYDAYNCSAVSFRFFFCSATNTPPSSYTRCLKSCLKKTREEE